RNPGTACQYGNAAPAITRPPGAAAPSGLRCALPRDCAPILRQMLRAAQRQSEDRIGWVRRAGGGEGDGACAVEVCDLVGLAEAVDHRVRRPGPHDGAANQVDRGLHGAALPYLLGVGRLGDLEALLEIGVPQRRVVVVVAVDDASERHAKLVLFARELEAVFGLGLFLPPCIHARKILFRPPYRSLQPPPPQSTPGT